MKRGYGCLLIFLWTFGGWFGVGIVAAMLGVSSTNEPISEGAFWGLGGIMLGFVAGIIHAVVAHPRDDN